MYCFFLPVKRASSQVPLVGGDGSGVVVASSFEANLAVVASRILIKGSTSLTGNSECRAGEGKGARGRGRRFSSVLQTIGARGPNWHGTHRHDRTWSAGRLAGR